MTLIKSLLLGSAAGIVAVASAQAADLPTRKGVVAAEYVRICTINVGGKPLIGFTLPGSDTCLKMSGYLTAQFEGGDQYTGYSTSYKPGAHKQEVHPARERDDIGYTTRLNLTFDAVSNTAAGPLAAHAEVQVENGSGFDNVSELGYINHAYVTWAGITAGKANSFYSFTGGGAGWANFFSSDQQGFNQPDLFAYTASFGGGFSATIAAQDPEGNVNGSGTNYNGLGPHSFYAQTATGGGDYTYAGMKWPDIVGQLKFSQGWGSAQVSGVAHNVNVDATGFKATQDKVGFGVSAGLSFNLPTFGAGDQIMVFGSYTENAVWYSGLADAMWGENGGVNGNGQQMALADTYFDGRNWQTPTAWSASAEFDHTFTSEFTGSLEGSVGGISWSNGTRASVVSDATSWIIGAVAHFDPVKNLDFEFEVLYQNTQVDKPNSYIAARAPWHGEADGAAARFEITRSW